jgi:hypothetical protein
VFRYENDSSQCIGHKLSFLEFVSISSQKESLQVSAAPTFSKNQITN